MCWTTHDRFLVLTNECFEGSINFMHKNAVLLDSLLDFPSIPYHLSPRSFYMRTCIISRLRIYGERCEDDAVGEWRAEVGQGIE